MFKDKISHGSMINNSSMFRQSPDYSYLTNLATMPEPELFDWLMEKALCDWLSADHVIFGTVVAQHIDS